MKNYFCYFFIKNNLNCYFINQVKIFGSIISSLLCYIAVVMCPGELTPASIFYNTSLKRDKESWKKSTVVTASQTTVLRTENCNSKSSFHSRETILPHR